MSSKTQTSTTRTTSIPSDAASTYSASTTYSYEKATSSTAAPSSSSRSSKRTSKLKSKTKSFLSSLGQSPTAAYDRAHPEVVSEQERKTRALEMPAGYMSSQIKGLM